MSIKLKQYLENSWYRGASQDRQSGYAAQFQYGENVNIRDMRNGVCLSGGATDVDTYSSEFSLFTYDGLLLTVDKSGKVKEAGGSLLWDIEEYFNPTPLGIEFGEDVYVVGSEGIWRLNATKTNIAPQPDPGDPDKPFFTGGVACVLNYANTFLLVGDFNKVWRVSVDGTVKLIREFDPSHIVFGLTQEGNYLKIYTSDGCDTKIHYAKGTFDVEYTGLVQTVSFKGLSINNNCITSDQGVDYAAFIPTPGEIKLAKISGYNKTDIRWTQTWDGEKIFGGTPRVFASDGVLFVSANEGIWTFTEYNGWLWGGCVEFKETNEIRSLFRYGERLYVCMRNGNSYILRYYDLSFHPAKYQSNGFLIGRVFDGGCAGLFKKNDQATITYNMPSGTDMELSYRYDRESFGYNKSNFYPIKKLTDTTNCYDIVVPTTPQVDKQESLLRKEEANDLILLENGNGILLEDMMVCPFNKTWNLLEYRFDLNTNNTSKTPTLYEHSLTYYDYMRKYR